MSKNEEFELHIRMKIHKFIILRFLIENDVNPLCVSLTHMSILYNIYTLKYFI